MQVFEDPIAFQHACLAARAEGELGFVPTMGYLHTGHRRLLERAAAHRTSALSIFVNPSQFGPGEDFARYPRNLEGDLQMAREAGVDLVLVPSAETLYPPGFQTRVEPGDLASDLEGAHRPGHFGGVATVVLKLLMLAQPTHAYFGQKDFQQLAIIRRMARDFSLPLEVVAVEIVREPDGLALSSRNVYLSAEERQRALCLFKGLEAARTAFAQGERDTAKLEEAARTQVVSGADRVDYVAVRELDSLQPIERTSPGRSVVLIAAVVGRTRLIDNTVLG